MLQQLMFYGRVSEPSLPTLFLLCVIYCSHGFMEAGSIE